MCHVVSLAAGTENSNKMATIETFVDKNLRIVEREGDGFGTKMNFS